jgi:hypothetical protein
MSSGICFFIALNVVQLDKAVFSRLAGAGIFGFRTFFCLSGYFQFVRSTLALKAAKNY